MTKTLGQKVIELWNKRRDKLVTDYAIAGWLLSPLPEIRIDSDTHQLGVHRNAVDRLMKKMYGAELADDSDELSDIHNTFWAEYELFQNKKEEFDKAYIWNTINYDLKLGHSHMWHKKNSFFQTKLLGKFACRVCSKIVGMGSAERNWGDVKHLKSMKRSHLSSEATEKQATIFGSSCMEDAALERRKAQENSTESFKFWDDKDFDSQIDMFAVPEPVSAPKRFIKCYVEEWEKEHSHKKDDVSKAKLLHKYADLEFVDVDHLDRHFKIDNRDLQYHRNDGWCVKAFRKGDPLDGKCTLWQINSDDEALHYCIATHYTKNSDLNVEALVMKDQKEVVADLATLEAELKKQPSRTETAHAPSKKRKGSSPRKKPPPVAEPEMDDMSLCGGCGRKADSAHKCDVCNRNMHIICGRGIGAEGHGQQVRCPKCDRTTTNK